MAINLDYLDRVQTYCDKRAYSKDMDYKEHDADWKDTSLGRIGRQLDCISASIEEIKEILNGEFDKIIAGHIR